MVNYNETIIYKLCCRNTEIKDIYVGHTCNFNRRKHEHKKCCNNLNRRDYTIKVYKFIRDNGNWDNWDMVMIEQYPCQNKLEAEKRERHWIETLNSTLNQVIPSRTKKEYKKKYHEENIEKIKENRSKKIVCECGCEITNHCQARHKKSNKHLELMKLK